ncbi:hypothetical protein ACFMBG_21195 [Leisingera sp. D0M16]|uniref:hypothetical protein n=1 Tax=Leisingera coralii TaxID=3351347 RepID=UPI003B81DBB3
MPPEDKASVPQGSGAAPDGGPAEAAVDDLAVCESIKPHFDSAHYLAQCPEGAETGDPVLHYLRHGAGLGLDPCPGFSTRYYLQQNADVTQSSVNPFWHYITHGKAEGRRPVPAAQEAQEQGGAAGGLEQEAAAIAEKFDPDFYRRSYANLPEEDSELPGHYLAVGWLLGHDPAPWFSTRAYLEANPDVAAARANPFAHYLAHGAAEQRPLEPPARTEAAAAPELEEPMAAIAAEAEELRPHFDAAFYLEKNSDVAEAGEDPLLHYCAAGWREERDPHPDFSTAYYLAASPDVREAGINPYLHYIRTGKAEGRFSKHPGGRRFEILTQSRDLEAAVCEWRRSEALPELLAAEALAAALAPALGAGARLILSIGHDDHHTISGGVQLCIQQEVALAAEAGDAYLAVYPWQPLPRLAHPEEDPDVAVCLRLNGALLGVARCSALTAAVAQLAEAGTPAHAVIHQFLGHNPEQITALVKACGSPACTLWLHDFLTLCPNYALQRNKLAYCGSPDPDSNACTVCFYGAERKRHMARVRAMFEALEVHVAAPSDSARALWSARGGLAAASLTVQPHVELSWARRSTPPAQAPAGPARLAFLGAPLDHKGWDVFCTLAARLAPAGAEIFCFSAAAPDLEGVRHVPVHVTAGGRNAMVEALSGAQIDFVLHWPSWPETFSFTTFEAMAAGAFIITNRFSGNVAAAVKEHRQGAVLQDQEDLISFFSDGRMQELLEKRRDRHKRYEAQTSPSSLSFALLPQKAAQ